MTIDEAKRAKYLLETIQTFDALPDKIRKLHKENKHDEVANIALELNKELREKHINELQKFKP